MYLSNLSRLMIPSEDGQSVGKSDFHGHEEGDCLDAIVTSINVVSHEQIVCVWSVAADSEQFYQIMELAMNITAHGDRAVDRLDILFCVKQFLGLSLISKNGWRSKSLTRLLNQSFDVRLGKRLALSQLL